MRRATHCWMGSFRVGLTLTPVPLPRRLWRRPLKCVPLVHFATSPGIPTATHCNTLQHTQQQHTATHCNAHQCTATHCSALQRTITPCNTTQRNTTQRNATQSTATQSNTMQRYTPSATSPGARTPALAHTLPNSYSCTHTLPWACAPPPHAHADCTVRSVKLISVT